LLKVINNLMSRYFEYGDIDYREAYEEELRIKEAKKEARKEVEEEKKQRFDNYKFKLNGI
jgi:hypothetical protein